jgi:hypothetical protein
MCIYKSLSQLQRTKWRFNFCVGGVQLLTADQKGRSSNAQTLACWKPSKTSQAADKRLSKLVALAVFSSDALSSVAYATEEILLVLILAGTAAVSWSIPTSLAIVLLLDHPDGILPPDYLCISRRRWRIYRCQIQFRDMGRARGRRCAESSTMFSPLP